MSDTMLVFLSICSLLSVIGIAVSISKWAAVRGTEKYVGKIVDIVPKYRGARYTVMVKDGRDQIKVSYYKRNTIYNTFRIGSVVKFYKIVKRDYKYYTPVDGYFTWSIGLAVIPWFFLLIP